jgi:hypothetical protein
MQVHVYFGSFYTVGAYILNSNTILIMYSSLNFVCFLLIGRAKEFDKPSNLLQRQSLFAALVQEYANRSAGL